MPALPVNDRRNAIAPFAAMLTLTVPNSYWARCGKQGSAWIAPQNEPRESDQIIGLPQGELNLRRAAQSSASFSALGVSAFSAVLFPFGIRISALIRHSSFVIRHYRRTQRYLPPPAHLLTRNSPFRKMPPLLTTGCGAAGGDGMKPIASAFQGVCRAFRRFVPMNPNRVPSWRIN
jgi:hypothetical protein